LTGLKKNKVNIMTTTPDIHEVARECNRLSENPYNINGEPDRYMAALFASIGRTLLDSSEFQSILQFCIDTKRQTNPFPASLAALALLRAFQTELMDDVNYPYEDPKQWSPALEEITTDPKRLDRMCCQIVMYHVSSDVATRAAGPKLVGLAYQPEIAHNPLKPYSILNIGASTGHTQLMLTGEVEFPRILINPDLLDQSRIGTLEDDINKLVNRAMSLGDCRSVDAFPLDDDFLRWAKACGEYTGERRMDPEKIARYDRLETIRRTDPRFKHTACIFGREDDLYERDGSYKSGLSPSDFYSAVYGLTFLYLCDKEMQREIFTRGLSYLNDDGLWVIQDFMDVATEVDTADPMAQLDIYGPTTEPFKYTTTHYDKNKPGEGMIVDAYWDTGRCGVMKPTQGFVNAMKEVF
jgi:hypothetical protein